MAYSNLVALKLTSASGDVERDIVVQESITLYNLHKVIQFCLAPSRGDEAIAGTSYTFMHDNKVIKAPKSTQLYRADSKNNQGCADGRSYTYRAGNGRTYTVTVTGSRGGDARYYVPRCYNGFGGNLNLDNINKKLLVRRFTAAGESKGRKQLPKVWYDKRTPASQLQAGYMAAMTEPLFPDPNANIVFPTYYGSF